jgi:hypothetical protein
LNEILQETTFCSWLNWLTYCFSTLFSSMKTISSCCTWLSAFLAYFLHNLRLTFVLTFLHFFIFYKIKFLRCVHLSVSMSISAEFCSGPPKCAIWLFLQNIRFSRSSWSIDFDTNWTRGFRNMCTQFCVFFFGHDNFCKTTSIHWW